ncbi:MAG: RpoL/Rpb11 RNA polymerase subunit family protein [Halobacteria archaeon]
MNVKILSKSGTETEVEIEGEDHTLLMVLKDALLNQDEVEAATYDLNPDQSGSVTDPILYVSTSGKDPIDAIEEATELIKEDTTEFTESFRKAVS